MKAADVSAAVVTAGIHPATVCASIKHLLPILRALIERRSWVIRWVLNQLVDALEGYRKEACP